MADKEINPNEISYEELAALSNQALAEEAKAETPARDGQGRFVAKEEAPQDAPAPIAAPEETEVPAEKVVYQKVIDFGDGSGAEVFEADSLEELVDKLAEGKRNASKKIRELTQEKRAAKVEEVAPTDDQEWALGQELLAKPSSTLKKQFEALVGMPLDSFKTKMERMEALEAAQTAEREGHKFQQAHPEFVVSEKNALKLVKACDLSGLPYTAESYEKVYTELVADGLLAIKEVESTTTDDAAPTPRIASSGARVVSVQGRAASGISSRRSAPPTVKSTEPTEAELYAMPMDKLEAYYNAKAAQQQR